MRAGELRQRSIHSAARLLVFTPTWVDVTTNEVAIAPECEAAIKSQADIDFDWHVTSDNPYPIGDHRNVLYQYQQAREWYLNSPQYDALLTIEHDNVLPDSGAVRRLLDTPGDVVYAPYMLRHGRPVLSTWQYINDTRLGMSLSNYPRDLRQARKNKIWRVSGTGMGCTLFRRHVLERIEFTDSSPRNPCPDLGFARAALQAGYLSHGRFDVPVLHYSAGRWLHPYDELKGLVIKYRARQTMNVLVDGTVVGLIAGEEVELPPDRGGELLRAGFLEALSVLPAGRWG